MANLYEYYNTGDDTKSFAYGVIWCAQTFTPSIAHTITSVKLLLYRKGSPGTITVSIRATSSGHPTGADLCSGTINGNTLTTDTAGLWYEITLGAGYALSATKYATIIRALSGDTSNWIGWRADISNPTYTGGCFEYSTNSGTGWFTYTVQDMMFEDWGKDPKLIVGSGSVAIASGVHKYMVGGWKKPMGGGSVAIAGGMSYDKLSDWKRAMGGGLISMAGSLARRWMSHTGRMSVTMKFHKRNKTTRLRM